MGTSSQSERTVAREPSDATFEWRGLQLHVVTREPLPADQARTIERIVHKVPSVGVFADVVGMVTGRHVRVRTERPSQDIWLDVGS